MNELLNDFGAALLLAASGTSVVMYVIKRLATFDLEVRTRREQARVCHLTSRHTREVLQLPAVGSRAVQLSHVGLSWWALRLLDPVDAERYALEWAAHLHERICDGEIREARVDRRRLVRHALLRAALQRLRHPRPRLTLADAQTLVEIRNRTVRYLLVIGQRPIAVRVAQHAVRLAAKHLTQEHPEALTSRLQHVDALQWAGRTELALDLAQQVLDDCERLLGADHELTVTARAQLALSYQWAGRNTDAVRIIKQVIVARTKLFGPQHPLTLLAQHRLAWSLGETGHYVEAVAMKRKLLALHVTQLGPEHSDTLTSCGSLAISLRVAGEYKEAITLLEETLSVRERLCGHGHPDTLWARANLGKCYELVGRVAEAVAIQQAVVPVCEKVLGPEHHDTLMYRTYLSSAYQAGAKLADHVGPGLDQAIRIIDEVVRDRQRLHRDHPDSIDARAQQARAYHDAGRNAEAIAILKQVILDAQRVRGHDHPSTSSARDTLAQWQSRTTER